MKETTLPQHTPGGTDLQDVWTEVTSPALPPRHHLAEEEKTAEEEGEGGPAPPTLPSLITPGVGRGIRGGGGRGRSTDCSGGPPFSNDVGGGAFSGILSSLSSADLPAQVIASSDESCPAQLPQRYDEFGFAIDSDSNPSRQQRAPFVEDPQHLQQWLAYLQFRQQQQQQQQGQGAERACSNVCWRCSRAFTHRTPARQTPAQTMRTEKVREMVRQGIPHSLRPLLWSSMCGASLKKRRSDVPYTALLALADNTESKAFRQIEEDLLRTMPSNACFSQQHSPGVPRLRRVLRAVACRHPDIGYCQGTGVIVATLLLLMEEEEAFWMMCAIIEDLLPQAYYSPTLTGVQVDQRVLGQLVVSYVPDIARLLQQHDVELSLISMQWLLTLLSGAGRLPVVLRLWDLLFHSGSYLLFHFLLAMLKLREEELKKLDSFAEIFSALLSLPGTITTAEELLEQASVLCSSLSSEVISQERAKYLTYLTACQMAAADPHHPLPLPTLQASDSLPWTWWWWPWGRKGVKGEGRGGRNEQCAEVVADLQDAIHLLSLLCAPLGGQDRKPAQADYSVDSHVTDMENYFRQHCRRRCRHHRRCRHVQTLREKDNKDCLHCRSNNALSAPQQTPDTAEGSPAEDQRESSLCVPSGGREGISTVPSGGREGIGTVPSGSNLAEMRDEAVSDLLTTRLIPALKAVLIHGLRKSKMIGGDRHPWLFIEEVAERELRKSAQNVFCRLRLSQTYRLDGDDCSIPAPAELLHLAVQAINRSQHLCHADLDLKFQAFLYCGLSEQVLHLWLEVLCRSSEVVSRWYQPWALLRSLDWVLLKCQLRLLNCSAFHRLPQGPQDSVLSHTLFSWDQ